MASKLKKCIKKEKVLNKTKPKSAKVNPRAKCHADLGKTNGIKKNGAPKKAKKSK